MRLFITAQRVIPQMSPKCTAPIAFFPAQLERFARPRHAGSLVTPVPDIEVEYLHAHAKEQFQLFRRLRRRAQLYPYHTASAMLKWYYERVQESRTRLVRDSADSQMSTTFLIGYATRRCDINTLQRLRAPAVFWTRKHLQDAAFFVDDRTSLPMDRADLPLTRLENALFCIAARQNNWDAMIVLLQERGFNNWTPFMCRAMLRTNGALDMVTREDAQQGVWPGRKKQALWSSFLDEFARVIQRSQLQDRIMHADKPRALPSWVTVALMELYSRSGKAEQAVAIMNMHIQTRMSLLNTLKDGSIVLCRAPSYLISNTTKQIPGPLLLNYAMTSFLRASVPYCALSILERLTRTPLHSLLPPSLEKSQITVPTLNTRCILEPNTNTIMLGMDAIAQIFPCENGRANALLLFLLQMDRVWGSFSKQALPSASSCPLFMDLRPIITLLTLCLKTNNRALGRRVLRFGAGMWRRERRWYEAFHQGKNTPRTSSMWRESPNDYTLVKEWQRLLLRLKRKKWVGDRHAGQLLAITKGLADTRKHIRLSIGTPIST